MKKLYFLLIGAFIGTSAFISSCSYNPGSTPPSTTPTALLNFKLQVHSSFDVTVVDTADANGNNPDRILANTRKNFQEIIVDTALTYMGKFPVARIIFFDTTLTPKNDTGYFYQDPNGDLYRYNFGFSILNQFTALTQFIGSQVNVGWVLAAKMTSAEGTQWVARTDSVLVQAYNLEVYLSSQGRMMADTTFLVGTETIKARHSRNVVTASAGSGSQTGNVVIDSYYSTDIGEVVEDFFRHVSLSGSFLNQQAQGKLKILTQK